MSNFFVNLGRELYLREEGKNRKSSALTQIWHPYQTHTDPAHQKI